MKTFFLPPPEVWDKNLLAIPKGDELSQPGVAKLPRVLYQPRSNPSGVVSMSQSLSSVILHIVFSTKGRFPFLSDEDERRQVHAFLGGIAKNSIARPF